MTELPTVEYLHECFVYDPETGTLMWKTRPLHHFKAEKVQRQWNTRHAGKSAGRILHGYVWVHMGAGGFLGHRLIWAMMTGKWPEQLDHKNCNPADNRWSNLREATQQQNFWNRPRWGGGALPRGVRPSRNGGRYWAVMATRKTDGIRTMKHLGTFDTPEEAHAAWCAAASAERGEFFRSE